MTPKLPCFHIARLTLETVTPLSIAEGGADGVFDVTLARDANGLPAIPGSSLAGVLRHLYWDFRQENGETAANDLFGWQEHDEGAASPLHVSWGAIQDSQGMPVEGLLIDSADQQRLKNDPLLDYAVRLADMPLIRDRVRIGHRGAAADTGKLDRAVLPTGYRFSAELSLWSETLNDPRWIDLLALLKHPLFRLGGGVRSGLGRMRLIQAHDAKFDLRRAEHRARFAALGRNLADLEGLGAIEASKSATPTGFVHAEIELTPRAFWRIGQGDEPRLRDPNGKPADLLPRLEARVEWQDGKPPGQPAAAALLIPGSSIKGALAHRVAFHANRLNGYWAENHADRLGDYDKSEHCLAVRQLFGYARDDRTRRDDESERGRAGRIYIDDAWASFTERDLKLLLHTAIDRFTGGVREHMLYSEELVWAKPVKLNLLIDTRSLGEIERKALRLALADLCAGRLALGGGAAKGHGWFKGHVTWDDDGRWIGWSQSEHSEEQAT